MTSEIKFDELRFDWWGKLSGLEENPPAGVSLRKLNSVVAFAADFISRWADWAEMAKMQPAHLLARRTDDPTVRGLAWRWTDRMDVLCWPTERCLIAESVRDDESSTLFAYRFEPDGRVRHVFGQARAELLSTQIVLDASPTIRQRYIAAGEG